MAVAADGGSIIEDCVTGDQIQMGYTQTTVGELLSQLDKHSWKHWVFAPDPLSLNLDSLCVVIDTDAAEVGKDGFTPLVAEQQGMQEFLSIQDILMVKEHLFELGFRADEPAELFAVKYYFENDAYPGTPALAALTSGNKRAKAH